MDKEVFLSGRLVVISHKRHVYLSDGRLSVYGGFAKLKGSFAKHVSELHLCVPVYRGHEDAEPVDYPDNVVVHPLSPYSNRFSFIFHLPVIVATLWREIGHADLVYAMGPNDMGLLGLLIARIRRRPFFCSVDTDRAGKARSQRGRNAKLKAWMLERTVHKALRWLAGGRPTYVTGDLFLGALSNWKQWIKTTITTKELPPYRAPNAEIPTRFRVIFVGRLAPEKNIECLIEAVSLYAKAPGAIELQIVGQGPEKSSLENCAAEQIPGLVTFQGHVSNNRLRGSRFLDSDVLVLPSREERQGKVLLEAMACSVPVIASNAGGIPSVIQHDDNGLLFEPDSPAELARCLLLIHNDSNLRRRLVHNGYNFAIANTLDKSVSAIMNEVLAFYGMAGSCSAPRSING